MLKTLVESNGELVTKQTLMQAVWPGTIVEEANLTVQIATLRKVLDEGRTTASCIQTVIGRGYRFRPSVERVAPLPVTAPIETKGQPLAVAVARPDQSPRPRRRPFLWAMAAALAACLAVAALLSRQMSGDGSDCVRSAAAALDRRPAVPEPGRRRTETIIWRTASPTI